MGFHISAPHPGKRYKRIELKPLTSESKFGRLLWSAVSVCSSVKSFTPGEVAGGQWGSSRTLIQSNAVACSQGEISGNYTDASVKESTNFECLPSQESTRSWRCQPRIPFPAPASWPGCGIRGTSRAKREEKLYIEIVVITQYSGL